jgi:hypothetical protein
MEYILPVIIVIGAFIVVALAVSATWKKVPSDKAGVVVGVEAKGSHRRGLRRDPRVSEDGYHHP